MPNTSICYGRKKENRKFEKTHTTHNKKYEKKTIFIKKEQKENGIEKLFFFAVMHEIYGNEKCTEVVDKRGTRLCF